MAVWVIKSTPLKIVKIEKHCYRVIQRSAGHSGDKLLAAAKLVDILYLVNMNSVVSLQNDKTST